MLFHQVSDVVATHFSRASDTQVSPALHVFGVSFVSPRAREIKAVGDQSPVAKPTEAAALAAPMGVLLSGLTPATPSTPSTGPTITHAGPVEKLPLTVALIGAPGAGKSALAGHLQFCTGNLPAATVTAFERIAHGAVHGGAIPSSKAPDTPALPPVPVPTTARRPSTKLLAPKTGTTTTATSFQYAWLHDRARGADWAPTTLASTRYHVRVLDTRGSRTAMAVTTGALVRADLLVLVVSAVPSEWAKSMGTVAPAAPSTMAAPVTLTTPQLVESHEMQGEGGEARYLLMVAYAMGVRQVLVAVNKMDQVQWAGDRFTAVVKDTSSVLKKIGFNVKAVAFVPVAAIAGDGIMEPPPAARAPWYLGWRRDGKLGEKTGHSLMQAIDASNPPRKLLDRALRATVLEIHPPIHHTVHADGGTSRGGPLIVGRVEAGALRVGLDVRLAPTLLRATIRSCHSGTTSPLAPAPVPNPGSTVAFVLDGIFPDEIHVGDVIGPAPTNSTKLPPSSAAAPGLPPVPRPWSSSASPPPSPTRAATSRKSGGAGANDTADPARPAAAMTLVILVLVDHARVLAPGWTPTLAVHAARVKVKVTDLVGKVDRRSGQVIEDRPRHLHPGDAAAVRCVPLVPVCVEPVADVPSMARIVLLDTMDEVGAAVARAESAAAGRGGEGVKKVMVGRERPVAVGVIKSVDKYDDDGKVFTCPRKRSV
ncbi:hypothetical protein AMAG_05371 [Allomyces macrogynus ATCC 38327]|uniref:Tr-type G domain-containing protein n=1 Tax=Allomyces macrogynus (strain ATCC 38327) TaxID=578462 RepID=A0A0L0SBV5_ALLM3|nr:hypothetical protein AMAG_05371 [Allomyces macrogynus ATCC 38327]|eukprot:KNE59922.1 hypothetical protein AMAG_05371 [Allomyces macrogynus ATCC 38327]